MGQKPHPLPAKHPYVVSITPTPIHSPRGREETILGLCSIISRRSVLMVGKAKIVKKI